jgi:hypothetical protein
MLFVYVAGVFTWKKKDETREFFRANHWQIGRDKKTLIWQVEASLDQPSRR